MDHAGLQITLMVVLMAWLDWLLTLVAVLVAPCSFGRFVG
jgi:hypothetical protein